MNRNLNPSEFGDRLFDPGPETHEPGDWYHFSRTNEEWDPTREGRVHVGTPQAAMDRAWQTGSSPGAVHAFRIRTPMENTAETPLGDVEQMEAEVSNSGRSYYYTNEVEDFGSVSASVPSARQLEHVGTAHHTPSKIKRRDGRVLETRISAPQYQGDTDRYRATDLGPDIHPEQPELPGMPDKPSPFDAMKSWR